MPNTNSPEQRAEALEKANRIRAAHAALKDAIAADPTWTELYKVLREERPDSGGMIVAAVMLVAPGLGPAKVKRTLIATMTNPSARVRELTARQADQIVGILAAQWRERNPDVLRRVASTGRPGWQARVKHNPGPRQRAA